MGLGSARDVTLTHARKRMEEIRINLVSKKIDPMAEREKALELGRVGKAKAVPFRERADQYITAHEGEGANHPSTGQQCATDVRRGKACSSATIRSGGKLDSVPTALWRMCHGGRYLKDTRHDRHGCPSELRWQARAGTTRRVFNRLRQL